MCPKTYLHVFRELLSVNNSKKFNQKGKSNEKNMVPIILYLLKIEDLQYQAMLCPQNRRYGQKSKITFYIYLATFCIIMPSSQVIKGCQMALSPPPPPATCAPTPNI